MAAQVEMLSGRRKKDFGAESAAEALAMHAAQLDPSSKWTHDRPFIGWVDNEGI